MMLAVLILGGLFLLFIGGEILVKGAISLAKSFRISVLVIGLTVVAFATSAPELFINLQAVLHNHTDIAMGNVIGSNISNSLLVLGAAAIIFPIAASNNHLRHDMMVLIGLSVLVHFFSFSNGVLSPIEGAVLVLAIVTYTVTRIRLERKHSALLAEGKHAAPDDICEMEEEVSQSKTYPIWQAVLFIVIGIVMLKFGADYFVEGAVAFARLLGISEAVIGLTLVAVGSSAPELAISIIAAMRKHSGIVIGNVIGSNIFNLASVLGITSLIEPLPVASHFVQVDLTYLLVITLALTFIIIRYGVISRYIGAVFLGSYGVYVLSLLYY